MSLTRKIKGIIGYVIVVLALATTLTHVGADTLNLVLYTMSTKGFLILVLTLVLFRIILRVISPSISAIKEYLRRSIILPYKLNHFQTQYRIATGSSVYAESYKNGKCVLLSGADNSTVLVKDMITGKEALCLRGKLVDSLNDLINKEGYRFYDPDSYKVLVEKGYRLDHA